MSERTKLGKKSPPLIAELESSQVINERWNKNELGF